MTRKAINIYCVDNSKSFRPKKLVAVKSEAEKRYLATNHVSQINNPTESKVMYWEHFFKEIITYYISVYR